MSSPIKVAQLLPRMHDGGAERGAVDLAREHHKSGAAEHVILAESGRLSAEVIKHGARFMPLPLASKNIFTAYSRARQLQKVLRAVSPDIVHVRSRVPAWLHFVANKKLNIPTVATAHGINSVSFYSKIMTRADAVICPGAAVAEHLQRAYGAKHLTVIGRGVDVEYFDPAKTSHTAADELRKEWDVQDNTVLLSVGRLSEQKGHENLLHALAKLPPHFVGVFVGEGRRRQRLISLARQLGVAARARFVGTRADMREVYAMADVVLSCAIYPESFGRTIAEALAMQKPVIAAAHGGAKDIITDDESGGVLVPPSDVGALVDALQKPMPNAEHSRERILKRFTALKMAEETLAVYKKILAEKGEG